MRITSLIFNPTSGNVLTIVSSACSISKSQVIKLGAWFLTIEVRRAGVNTNHEAMATTIITSPKRDPNVISVIFSVFFIVFKFVV